MLLSCKMYVVGGSLAQRLTPLCLRAQSVGGPAGFTPRLVAEKFSKTGCGSTPSSRGSRGRGEHPGPLVHGIGRRSEDGERGNKGSADWQRLPKNASQQPPTGPVGPRPSSSPSYGRVSRPPHSVLHPCSSVTNPTNCMQVLSAPCASRLAVYS